MPGQVATITDNSDFDIQSGSPGFRSVLLLSPPVYDSQYWAQWSQPAGLLRIGTMLKNRGYSVRLIDCMEAGPNGCVRKSRRTMSDRPYSVERDDITKLIWHFGLRWAELKARMSSLDIVPDEVWISSTMTYWWESTRDAVELARRAFPQARIVVGGIYPTLAPEHASEKTGADVVFTGEIHEASDCWTDLSLYDTPPGYAILTTTRGCPWECRYCAVRTLNDGSNRMRWREPADVLAEIEDKMSRYGVRRFGFYEDNALAVRGHLQSILELIIRRGHKLHLFAPEGFEPRLLSEELLRTMKAAGFKKIHIAFETLVEEASREWNRHQAGIGHFNRAVDAATRAGFRLRTEEMNAFVLFGLPDERIEDVLDSALYAHHAIGSIIPMLFTPVPGTQMYSDHKDYLHNEMGWDLQHLNGKMLPFLEYNRRRYPDLRASDYLELEALMSILNSGKVLSRAVDLCDASIASRAYRADLSKRMDMSHRAP